MTYLNHAGTSWPKPPAVVQAVRHALAAPPSTWAQAYETGRARIARAFGVAPERLLLTPGCTSALAVGVTDHPWAAGDRLLTSGLEHHALHRPAVLLRERGVRVDATPRGTDAPLDLDALRDALRRGGVRLVALTAACNVTGELLPVREAARLAHEHEALCLVDAAQLAGWAPAGLDDLGADLVAFAGHKALQGPWGLGGLAVAPGVVMSSPAATCELPAPGEETACATLPGPCDVGSVDRLALAGVVAALDHLEAPGLAERLPRARILIERLAGALEEQPGVRLHGVRDPERRLPTVSFTMDGGVRGAGRRVADLAAVFARAGVVVGAGLHCAPLAHETLGTAPEGSLRLSAGPSTTDAEVQRALEVIAGLHVAKRASRP